MFNYVDILGIDENEKTVLASYRNGSFSLDAIPAAVNYMKSKSGYTMLLKDSLGLVIQVDPESTIDSVEEAWLALKDINFKAMTEQYKQMVAAESSSQPTFQL